MRLPRLSGILVPLAAVATLACGGDDLVLPTDETPLSRLPTELEIYSGNGQVGTAGVALAAPVVVQVVDQEGAGLAGQTVSWSVATGEGSVTPSSVTNADGYASASWTLGNPGPNTLTATVAGLGAVTFIASANNSGNGGGGTGGGSGSVPSATTSTVSADPASIQVASGVSSIRVTVRDAAGAPVPGAVVTLSATGGGNTLIQPAGPTGADGVASGTLRSSVAGTKDVTAIVNGTVQIGQTAQVFVEAAPPPPPAAEPHHFVFRVPPRDVREEEWFTVEVAIVDASGNVVPLDGTEVYLGLFEVGDEHPTNGRLAGDRFEDTINGIATFRLYVDHEGSYRFLARSDYLPKHLGPYGPELFSNVFQVRD